jgi:hypothetical protein
MKRDTRKKVLTKEQERWLIKHFKHTKNAAICERLCCSLSTLARLARQMGLKKSKQFQRKCQEEAMNAAHHSHRVNGTWPAKGFAIPRRELYQFKKGERLADRVGEERAKEARAKAAVTLNEIRRKEKIRARWGLPQRTRLRVVPVPREKIALRSYLKGRGYIIDEEQRIAFYTDATHRASRLEQKNNPWYKYQRFEVNDNGKEECDRQDCAGCESVAI